MMKYTLFIFLIVQSMANMSKISEILMEEQIDFNNCDHTQTIAQESPSLGHKIAQVVCESRTKTALDHDLVFTVVKYGLFGVLCSLLTYLVSAFTNLESKKQTEEPETRAKNSAVAEPKEKEEKKIESPLFVVKQPVLDVLPDIDEMPLIHEDLTLDEKSLSISDDEKEKPDLKKYSELEDLDLPSNDVIDFETYKTNLELPKCYARPRSFSEPCGAEKYIAYDSLETSFNDAWVGELPIQMSPVLTAMTTQGNADEFDEKETDYSDQPGSPTHVNFSLQNEPGRAQPAEKINERKPMVFVGGVSASTTSIELVTELKSQGFNVTVLPRIRYGVSFGFCPDLVLSSDDEVEKLLALGRVWVKDRWIDVRPYIPKESETVAKEAPEVSEKQSEKDCSSPTDVIHIEDAVGDSVAYISREDLLNTNISSPPSSNESSPVILAENLSPVTPQFVPMNYFHMTPGFFPNQTFSPSHVPQMMPLVPPGFFPTQGEFVSIPSPPQGYQLRDNEYLQHPISMDASFN